MSAMPLIALSESGLFSTTSVITTPVSAARLDAVSESDSCPVATSSFEILGMPYVLKRAKNTETENTVGNSNSARASCMECAS